MATVSSFSIAPTSATPSLEQQQKDMQARIPVANRSVVAGLMNARPNVGEASGKTGVRTTTVPNQNS